MEIFIRLLALCNTLTGTSTTHKVLHFRVELG